MVADDEALALSLLSSRRVAPRALVEFDTDAALPPLPDAVAFGNKPVYRKLVERGATLTIAAAFRPIFSSIRLTRLCFPRIRSLF